MIPLLVRLEKYIAGTVALTTLVLFTFTRQMQAIGDTFGAEASYLVMLFYLIIAGWMMWQIHDTYSQDIERSLSKLAKKVDHV